MIRAEELRIGNWVSKATNEGWKEVQLKPYEISDVFEEPIDFNPIPITEERLRKFGIKVVGDNPKQKPQYEGDILFYIDNFEFSNSGKNGFYCYEINGGNTVLEYTYQLQNFYFAIKGEELKLSAVK